MCSKCALSGSFADVSSVLGRVFAFSEADRENAVSRYKRVLKLENRRIRASTESRRQESNYQILGELTPGKGESPEGVGVRLLECEWVFSRNRKKASGCLPPIHTSDNTKPQDGSGIQPHVCVRVGLQVGSVQYNTTQQIRIFQNN